MEAIVNNEEQQNMNEVEKVKQTQCQEQNIKKSLFTTKCKWIAFSIICVLVLGGISAGVVVVVIRGQKRSSVPTLVINQRDEFSQNDQICMQHTTYNLKNCTEIKINTTRVTVDANENNATSLVILKDLKVSSYQEAADGTRTYQNLTEQNNQIETELKRLLRILQEDDNNLCYGIDKSECGDVNQVPLLSVVTNQQTGNVEQIGVPSGVSSFTLQPLVSNIVHISPNTEEPTNSSTSSNGRILIENNYYSNLYFVGVQAFLPKFEKEIGQNDQTIIRKTISKSQWVNSNVNAGFGLDLLDSFDQQQESIFDKNNNLVSSSIRTSSLVDSSVTSSDPNDASQQSQTQINSDSNLVTIETKTDKDLTSALSDIKSKQTVNYYTAQELQTKIVNNSDENQNTSESQDYSENDSSTSDNNNRTTINNSTSINNGNRILQDENGDVSTSDDSQYTSQQSECNSTTFSQKRKLKEVTVLKQKVAIQTEFSGQTSEKNGNGYIQTCLTLNGDCLYLLQRDDFSFSGPEIKHIQKGDSKSSNLFSVNILLMGYPVTVGADISYSWSLEQSNIATSTERGVQESISAALSVSAYGEINLIGVIKIQAGVSGNIFKGYVVGAVRFGYDSKNNLIQFKRYLISIDLQLEVLTMDVYASYRYIKISLVKHCVGSKWCKICWWLPEVSYSDWKDIYRQSFALVKISSLTRIFELKSKCY